MTEHADKKYDVAISFRWTDIEQVRELYELLRDRMQVFLADDRLEEFVGTDGEESFGYIFRDQSRIVVIFYRPDWGSTPYTRAEEAAIKQRAFSEGYGFTIWVPMDAQKSIPPYLPPQYIWFDFERYGVSGLASVIEARVRENGVMVRNETMIDRLKQINRRIDLDKNRRLFQNSQSGFEFVTSEAVRFESVLTESAKQFSSISNEIPFIVKPDGRYITVSAGRFKCQFVISPNASYLRGEPSLHCSILKYDQKRPYSDQWVHKKKIEFQPTLNEVNEPAWVLQDNHNYNLESAISHMMEQFAEMVYTDLESDPLR